MNKSLLLLLALVAAALLANVFVSCGDEDDDDDDDDSLPTGDEYCDENYPDQVDDCLNCWNYGLQMKYCDNPIFEVEQEVFECMESVNEGSGAFDCFFEHCSFESDDPCDYDDCALKCDRGVFN